MVDLIDEGAPIVSNQVSYSVIDTRPSVRMAGACKEHDVKLLCYGVLLVINLHLLLLSERMNWKLGSYVTGGDEFRLSRVRGAN